MSAPKRKMQRHIIQGHDVHFYSWPFHEQFAIVSKTLAQLDF